MLAVAARARTGYYLLASHGVAAAGVTSLGQLQQQQGPASSPHPSPLSVVVGRLSRSPSLSRQCYVCRL